MKPKLEAPNSPNSTVLPCRACGARCCRYVAVEIDRPASKRECDEVMWYLLHRSVNVFIDHDDDWYLEFETPCEDLLPNHDCGRYRERPQVCRDHGWPSGSCEYFANPVKELFRTPAEFGAYLDARGVDWRWKRRPKPPGA